MNANQKNLIERTLSTLACLAALALGPAALAQTPLGSGWTYQGQLKQGGSPLNDTADFSFSLWDADAGGNMVGMGLVVPNITVVDGLFTVELDFGVMAFNGEDRWLEIAVASPSGSGVSVTLSPRQPLTAIPYSLQTRGIFADDTGKVGIGTTSPEEKLDVAGIVRSSTGGFKFPDDTVQTTAATGGLWNANGDDTYYDAGNVGIGTTTPAYALDVHGEARIYNTLHAPGGVRFNYGGTQNIAFDGHSLNAADNNPTDALYLNNNGWVGIGTTDPSCTLDVDGVVRSTLGYRFPDSTFQDTAAIDPPWTTNGNDIYYNAGNVGIGSDTVTSKLTVADERDDGEGSPSGGITFNTTFGQGWGHAAVYSDGSGGWNGDLVFATDGDGTPNYNPTEKMRITHDGRVGIGTDSPSADLDVRGIIKATSSEGSLALVEIVNRQSAWVDVRGRNGNRNLLLANSLNFNEGVLAVYDEDGAQRGAFGVFDGVGTLQTDVKHFVVPHPGDPSMDIVYASIEGPEAAMYVRGTGRLVNGRATIELPQHFTALAASEGITVILTPLSADTYGLAAVSKSTARIEVRELKNGVGAFDFDWEVKAVRQAHQDYQVVRPWTEMLLRGGMSEEELWEARLRSVEQREQRIAEMEARLAGEASNGESKN